ncbi:MAG: site-specific DNA-methyltransferase [Oligoflexia bacterium]|nr:site-specific DNA-methyltransferase [Oligoflexia bacterium]
MDYSSHDISHYNETNNSAMQGKQNKTKKISCKNHRVNMAILGDNLISLDLLNKYYAHQKEALDIDMIYIDPPYNVGVNYGYNNTWKGESRKFFGCDWIGSHGSFLDFMEPRLKIGHHLLAEHGVMFVSICDKEYPYLKIVMDKIFDAKNNLGTIIWNKTGGSASYHLNTVHEYILVYAKNIEKAPSLQKYKKGSQQIIQKANEIKKSGLNYIKAQSIFKEWIHNQKKKLYISPGEAEYKYLHPETFRPFRVTASCAQDRSESRCHLKLRHPVTAKACLTPSKGWKWSKATLLEMYKHTKYYIGDGFVLAGKICYGKDENSVPGKIKYLDEDLSHKLPTIINLSPPKNKDLPPNVIFSTPKPVALIKELIRSLPNKNISVLDYFAGSGTTAQAVYELNKEDNGNRSWILIEEVKNTFQKVLLKRLEHIDPSSDYRIYEFHADTSALMNKI